VIVLTEAIKERLKANWDARALNMQCHAEACITQEDAYLTYWLLAMNPQDEDEVIVLGNGFAEFPFTLNLPETLADFEAGDHPFTLDKEFKRQSASEIYKRIRGKK
jgi:hypothetical protein